LTQILLNVLKIEVMDFLTHSHQKWDDSATDDTISSDSIKEVWCLAACSPLSNLNSCPAFLLTAHYISSSFSMAASSAILNHSFQLGRETHALCSTSSWNEQLFILCWSS